MPCMRRSSQKIEHIAGRNADLRLLSYSGPS
jgi:hypothetical protein